MEEGLIKKLMSSIKCSACGQRHEPYDITVLGHHEDIWFLQIRCTSCSTESLVAAIIKASRAPVPVSDLTAAEARRSVHSKSVSSDDLLDMHTFLTEFNGDFSDLLARE